MKSEIELRQTDRFIILYNLYKETSGRIEKHVDILNIAAKHDIKNGNYKEAYKYLVDEGYIKLSHQAHHATITHSGKKVVETITTNPDEKISNFPTFNDMHL